MAVVGVGEILITPSMAGFQREVGKEVAGTGDSKPVKTAGYDLGKGLKNAAKVGVAGAAAVLGTAMVKGFGRLKAIEDARATLSGLGHDAQSVETIMGNANNAVKGTAFGLGDAATAAAAAVASGVKPGEDLERTLKLMGDAATIGNVSLGEMAGVFNKVAASGKIQGDVIAQLGDKGIPILQLLGEELGKTPEEVAKMASAGEVSFDTFRNAMEKGMGGAAQESGKTLSGAMDNSMAAIGRFGANLIQDIYPQLTTFFNGFIEWMGPVEELGKVIGKQLGDALRSTVDWLAKFGQWIKDNRAWIEPLAVAIGAMVTVWALWTGAIKLWSIATRIAATAQKLFNAVLKANPIMKIIMLVAAFVAAIVWLYNNNETARKIIDAAWTGIKNAFSAVWNFLKPIFQAFGDYWTGIIAPAIRNAWENVLKPAFKALGDFFSWVWNSVLKPAFTALSDGWKSLSDGVKHVWETYIKPVFQALGNFIEDTVKPAFQRGVDGIKKIWDTVKSIAYKPVDFVVNTVYNDGLRAMVNGMSDKLGLKWELPRVNIPAFAKGGQMKDGWKLVGEEGPELINTGPGYVYTANETKKMLAGQSQMPKGALDQGEQSHEGIGGFWSNVWGGITDTVGKVKDWAVGMLAAGVRAVTEPLKNSISAFIPGGGFNELIRGAGFKVIDSLTGWATGMDDKHAPDGGAMFYDGPLGSFAKPANGPITSGFGASRGRYPHAGIDFAVGIGSAVRAMLNGVVRKIGWNAVAGRTGKGMVLDHANGLSSYYGHLSGWGKKPGDQVSAGERIASSGNTGRSTGPHLHAELWNKGKPFNFMSYLYDSGGVLPTGLRMIANASNKPEAILSNSQWKNMSTLANQAAQNMSAQPVSLDGARLVLDMGAGKTIAGVVEMEVRSATRNRGSIYSV